MGKPPWDKAKSKKAADGDKDAALDLVLDSPSGSMKEDEDEMGFAKRVNDQGGYASNGAEKDEEIQALQDILEEHGVEDAHGVAMDICEAIHAGNIPHVKSDNADTDTDTDTDADEGGEDKGPEGNPFDDIEF